MEGRKLLKRSTSFFLFVIGYFILVSSSASCSSQPGLNAPNGTTLLRNPTPTSSTLPLTPTDSERESPPITSVLASPLLHHSNATSPNSFLLEKDLDDYGNVKDVTWCDRPEFELTHENWNIYNTGKWYQEWASMWKTDPQCKTADGQVMDEPSCFARVHLGIQDFSCSVSNNGCDAMPSCHEIVREAGFPELARKIYFVLKQYQMYYKFWNAIDRSFSHAEVSLAHQIKAISTTFSWSHDKQAVQKCTDMAVNLKRSASSIVGQIFGWLPGVFNLIFRDITKGLAETIGLIPSEAQQLTVEQLANRLCANQIIAPKNYAEIKEENLKAATAELFEAIRASILNIVQKGASGSDTKGMLSMSESIAQGVFVLSNAQQTRITDGLGLQNDIKKIAKSSIIEQNLKSENCFVTCHGQYYSSGCRKDIQGLCVDGYHDCQVSCMRNDPRQATTVKMFGSEFVKDLGAWGFTEESLIQRSVRRYIENGYRNSLHSSADTISMIKRGEWSHGAATPRLPMCHSVTGRREKDPHVLIFEPSRHWNLVDKPGRGARDVNCVCQSRLHERLEETKTFYEVTHLPQAPFWNEYSKICAEQHGWIGMYKS